MQHSVLITGTSRGIGLEFVRQYAEDGWRVYATCRAPEQALELSRLAAANRDRVSLHPLDVTEPRHLEALRSVMGDAPLDLLINNAGALGPKRQEFGQTHPQAWLDTLLVNSVAPLKVVEVLADNLAAAKHGIVANLSSKMGSIVENDDGGYYIYRSSKAALNAAMKSASVDLKARGITVVLLHPGWVRTAMGGPEAELEPAQSVARMRRNLAAMTPADSGRFIDIDGTTIPW